MKDTLNELIKFLEIDNENFHSKFPEHKPIFEYSKASDEELNNFEKQFNLILPDFLRNFYKNFNSIRSSFMFTEIIGTSNILKEYNEFPDIQELVDDKIIPIANDNGDLMCIDAKINKNQLFHFSHEDGNLSNTYLTIEEYIQDLIKQKIEHNSKK